MKLGSNEITLENNYGKLQIFMKFDSNVMRKWKENFVVWFPSALNNYGSQHIGTKLGRDVMLTIMTTVDVCLTWFSKELQHPAPESCKTPKKRFVSLSTWPRVHTVIEQGLVRTLSSAVGIATQCSDRHDTLHCVPWEHTSMFEAWESFP
jgi:hypothetical protein